MAGNLERSAVKQRLLALVFGCAASGVAMLIQSALRDVWQVRTLPERVMEWLLLFVPLDLFERGLSRLGADAKEVALTGTVVGMALVLAAVGALVLALGWGSWRLLGLGVAIWLVAMAVVMPITGAGLFATGLLVSPLLTNAGYLAVFLGYATVLLLGRLLLTTTSPKADQAEPRTTERRTLPADVTTERRPVPADVTTEPRAVPADVMPERPPVPANLMPERPPVPADVTTERRAVPADLMAERPPVPADLMPGRPPVPADLTTERRAVPADLTTERPPVPADVMAERRALLAGAIGTLLAGGVAAFLGRHGGLVASTLPLAAPPRSPTPAQPSQATTAATAGEAGAQAAADTGAGAQTPEPQSNPTATSQPPARTPQPTATPEPFPNPPPPRHVARDKDGSLTAAGRARGDLAPPITSNDTFYIVTKNAVQDPIVDAATWRLVVDGEVNGPVQIDYRTLRALPPVDVTKTLECISNFTAGCNLTPFGCDLVSTARWRGARLADVIGLAGGLKPSAVGLALLSTDEFSAGLPITVVDDPETLVVYEMNDQPLPREHGFPARLLVPGRYGMKNPKWLAGIRAMSQEYAGWYEQRNWNKDGIVKTMARIDVPADGVSLSPGNQRAAGIAYAGDRGVSKVELSADDGATWQAARFIEPMPGKDAMVRWESTFVMPASGKLTLTVRATDGTGEVQTDEFQLPQPDGASGRDSITVTAA